MRNIKLIFTIFLLFFFFQNNLLATEYATFESFYVESSYVGWIIAGIVALLAGLAIFFSWGAATPLVASIGTWVGTMAGYSGIAATNYGLALIGFGSIATGGLGIVGGAAILTVALTFSTEIVIDYTLGNIVSAYSYNKFAEDSKKMITLPLPQNENGSKAYENSITYLKKNINNEIPLSANSNQIVLKEASSMFSPSINDEEELIKENTLKSYLYFVTNDYKNAKLYANNAITEARRLQIKRTMPAFIYATSSLYDKSFNFDKINNNYFRYSILAEPENKLTPLMFAIYLDRIMYRMNDDISLNYKTINTIRDIALEIKNEEMQKQSLVIVLMRYFMKLKIEQQKIVALANTSNKAIKSNKKTLAIVRNSFVEYKNLLNSLKEILKYAPIREHIKENEDLNNLYILNAKYEENTNYLRKIMNDLQDYQDRYHLNKTVKKQEKSWWKFW